jgi:hypothetical protein
MVASPPPPVRSPLDSTAEGGELEFTATQVINSLGRQPEAWEASIQTGAHMMRVPIPDLAGYVVSRIGTPKASTRRTVEIPIRVTHMDTLMPQDFVLQMDFRGAGAGPGNSPAVSARRTPTPSDGKTVPMSLMVGTVGTLVVLIVALLLFFLTRMG